MCGIAGLANRRAHDFRQEAERRVQTMIDVQAHRGPDGEGLWSTSIGATGVTLGQKRLLTHRDRAFPRRIVWAASGPISGVPLASTALR
jgi:asparagine synthetase B (glutamine-hydrolysing)